ncbi:MAG: hypothetical protein KFBDDELM_00141 [Candidatus Argoarchaeum ethanivorans]|uniref:Uncharacterized protein n=1 Tax=Candidatus Argoarchaeum ethanivorans TaxID=2608793 RepID=A0A811T4P3_9EURY|nr:MAG: hypothetical protein KFBDDELM_00141 [Candidatus Argoarchaeum ethanivorans]
MVSDPVKLSLMGQEINAVWSEVPNMGKFHGTIFRLNKRNETTIELNNKIIQK